MSMEEYVVSEFCNEGTNRSMWRRPFSSRAQIQSVAQPRIIPIPEEEDEDEGIDSDDSDRKSKMSFSYWGKDKVTLQKPLAKHRPDPGAIGSRRNGPAVPSGYSRETSTNDKFGNRLVSADSLAAEASPASRRNLNTPSYNVGQARQGVVSMEE
jgi:hypothetical protein